MGLDLSNWTAMAWSQKAYDVSNAFAEVVAGAPVLGADAEEAEAASEELGAAAEEAEAEANVEEELANVQRPVGTSRGQFDYSKATQPAKARSACRRQKVLWPRGCNKSGSP